MKLSATLDLGLVALEQADELTLLVELTAPEAANHGPRSAATFVAVVDRSGSMAGDRLTGACEALASLVDRIPAADNFGVVAFDDGLQVVVPTGPIRDKAAVKAALRSITPGGSTDLSAGYFRGLQEAQRVAGPAGAVLQLISDGHANAGLTDPVRLEQVARQAHSRGVTTSTLGFGLGYDEQLLASLARGGQGAELFAEEADTAAAKMSGELSGLLGQVAQAASLRVKLSPDVQALAVLNDVPLQPMSDGVTIELGSLFAGESRKLVLRFRVPGIGALGLAQIATLELKHVSLPELVQHSTSVPVLVNVVPGDQAAGRVPQPAVRAEALFQQTQSQKRQSSQLLSQGRVPDAVHLLRSAADALRTEAAKLPQDHRDELLHESSLLRGMAAEADAGHIERAAKSASYDATYKSRMRGRPAASSIIKLVRADGQDEFALEEWRVQPLRRLAAAAGLSLQRAGLNGADVAQALATRLQPGDPLQVFLAGAARHGGFTLEAS